MLWVKGELLTDIDAPGVDPSGQLERATQASLFARKQWFRRIWRHEGTTPLVARAASEGALAWLFLQRTAGSEVKALANWYSFAFAPVYAGDPEPQRRRAMLSAIAKRLRAARQRISMIDMAPIPEEEAELLASAFRRGGWQVATDPCSTSWTADVEGQSFEEYWAARPGQLRNTFKRKSGKAEFEVNVLTSFDAGAWDEYEAVYADSWKPEEGAPAFLRELAETESEAGCLRLGICRLEGVAVAAQFWTVENGVALIHKLAHRETARELSPGTVLSEAMFRHVIDRDRVSKIDFGTGNDAYKADWMDRSAPLMRVRSFNPATMAGLVASVRVRLSGLVHRNTDG